MGETERKWKVLYNLRKDTISKMKTTPESAPLDQKRPRGVLIEHLSGMDSWSEFWVRVKKREIMEQKSKRKKHHNKC